MPPPRDKFAVRHDTLNGAGSVPSSGAAPSSGRCERQIIRALTTALRGVTPTVDVLRMTSNTSRCPPASAKATVWSHVAGCELAPIARYSARRSAPCALAGPCPAARARVQIATRRPRRRDGAAILQQRDRVHGIVVEGSTWFAASRQRPEVWGTVEAAGEPGRAVRRQGERPHGAVARSCACAAACRRAARQQGSRNS